MVSPWDPAQNGKDISNTYFKRLFQTFVKKTILHQQNQKIKKTQKRNQNTIISKKTVRLRNARSRYFRWGFYIANFSWATFAWANSSAPNFPWANETDIKVPYAIKYAARQWLGWNSAECFWTVFLCFFAFIRLIELHESFQKHEPHLCFN